MTSAQLQSVYIVEDVQRNRPIISAEQLISLQNWNYKYFFKLTSRAYKSGPNFEAKFVLTQGAFETHKGDIYYNV